MKNPYEEIIVADETRLSRGGLRLAVFVFFAFLLVPVLTLFENGGPAPSTHVPMRKQLEERAQKMPLLERWRRQDQSLLTRLAGAGNQRVLAGRDGWLYYRSDLDAIHGKGPYYEEPASVAREKVTTAWRSPVPVILDFAGQLSSRGIRLVIVPVPTKPMVCREGLGLAASVTPPAVFSQVMTDLTASRVEVVDLFPLLSAGTVESQHFLKQDTHWTPSAMEATAALVAARVTASGVARGDLTTRLVSLERGSRGDLTGMLGAAKEDDLFAAERVTLHRVVTEREGTLLASDVDSPVVVLGDSFVNIYEDPALGFAEGTETSIGAGFSSHLAAALRRPVHSIAINGGGASGVREAFAALPGEVLSKKKTVVWLLSSRDLLLAEIPARRAGIEWRELDFPDASIPSAEEVAPSGEREITGTLREKSFIEDPAQTPYASAIYSTLFTTDDGQERLVFLWAFRDRKLKPEAAIEPGRRYRLRLVPLEGEAEAGRATRLDDFFRPELTPWFAGTISPAE
jgi:hypothetical protein